MRNVFFLMEKKRRKILMKTSQYQTIVHPLKPLYNNQSKILILGSFPSVKTREYGFFTVIRKTDFGH